MLTQEYVDNGGMGVHVTLRESLELSIYGPSSQGIPTLVPWMRSKWQGGRLGAQYSATVRNSICAVHWSRSRHSEDWKSVEGRREIERNSVGEGYDATTFDSVLERGDDNDGQRVMTRRPPSFQTPLYTIQILFFETKLCFPHLSPLHLLIHFW